MNQSTSGFFICIEWKTSLSLPKPQDKALSLNRTIERQPAQLSRATVQMMEAGKEDIKLNPATCSVSARPMEEEEKLLC